MISLSNATLRYEGAPVFADVNFEILAGEFVLLMGATGSGKSSLLRVMNGLTPHLTGGELTGDVQVNNRSIRNVRPRELAESIGYIGQDPLAGFVSDRVEDELAFTMESLGLSAEVMRKRVEETLDLLGLNSVRHRSMATLSAGEQQRVAIGAALTAHPKILLLDEPTSALDPTAADEVLALLQRLVHDVGMTIIIAEHRLERVVQYVDRIIHVHGDGRVSISDPTTALQASALVPPLIELARLESWEPLPLTIRDARRLAEALRERLSSAPAPRTNQDSDIPREIFAQCEKVSVAYGKHQALRDISLNFTRGSISAVMGRNGAGKSTLLATFVGLNSPEKGSLTLGGHSPSELSSQSLSRLVGFVPQEPGDLLFCESVSAECAENDKDRGLIAGTTINVLNAITPDVDHSMHPRDLSEGQRLAVALAVVAAAEPPLLLLDEPTRGLDYLAKARLGSILRKLAHQGRAIVLATHDVELVAEIADRVIVLAEGDLVADGSTVDVLTSSPAFAPQVQKILAPSPFMTVQDVINANLGQN
ncbi:MAG: ATP-binding cassette domain-containing protein [Actinomycetes bacterium]